MDRRTDDTRTAEPRHRAVRTLLVAVPALALLVVLGVTGRSAALLAIGGLAAVVTGFVALVGRPGPSRGRKGAVAVLAVGGAGLLLGGTAFGAPGPVPSTTALRPAAIAADTRMLPAARPLAVAVLSTLPVKGASPMTGYARNRFGTAWFDEDRNGCDTRNDVLRRDLTKVTGTRCTVLTGVLHDPYTGSTIRFVRGQGTSEAVQIDHVVPLADAWRTGAQQLTKATRVSLANDPANLLAVDGPTNTRKSDGDAATWLPKRKAYRCDYVARQIAVKHAYRLWVTKAERAAMQRVLTACPRETVPVVRPTALADLPKASAAPRPSASRPASADPSASATPSTSAAPAASTAPSASTAPAPSAAPSGPAAAGVVHPGAFCSEPGATGVTAAGTPMVCRTSATDDRDRWRRAA